MVVREHGQVGDDGEQEDTFDDLHGLLALDRRPLDGDVPRIREQPEEPVQQGHVLLCEIEVVQFLRKIINHRRINHIAEIKKNKTEKKLIKIYFKNNF